MDAATRFEDVVALLAEHDVQSETLAGADALDDLLAVPAEIDHDVFDARSPDAVEVPLEQALAADLDERFRDRVGQRAQPLAAARCEDHRDHDAPSNAGRQRASMSSPRNASSS